MHNASNLRELAPLENQNIHHCRWEAVTAFQACAFLENPQRHSIFLYASSTNVYREKNAIMGEIQVKAIFKPLLNIPDT